jgi:uncharacterized protein YybS (DUF2232 family)
MKTFIFSILSMLSVFFILTVTASSKGTAKLQADKSIMLDSAALKQIEQGLPIKINIPATDQSPTPSVIVKYILSILGGILTAIILKLLHHWFPLLFPSTNTKDYTAEK